MEANRPKDPDEGKVFGRGMRRVNDDDVTPSAAACDLRPSCAGSSRASGCDEAPRLQRKIGVRHRPPATVRGLQTQSGASLGGRHLDCSPSDGEADRSTLPLSGGGGGDEVDGAGAGPAPVGGGGGPAAVPRPTMVLELPPNDGARPDVGHAGSASPMDVGVGGAPDPSGAAGGATPVMAARALVSPGEAASPGSQRRQGNKGGSGSGGKAKGKGKGGGKELDMDLDLPDLDSEPDLSEPEPEPEAEADEDDGEEAEAADEGGGVRVANAPAQAPLASAVVAGGEAGGQTEGRPGREDPDHLPVGANSGAAAGFPYGAGGSRNGSDVYGSGSHAGDGDTGGDSSGGDGSSSDDDEEAAERGGAGGGILGSQRRRRKHNRKKATTTAAGQDGAITAAERDAPSFWDDGDDYIYKDVDPNDLDIGIEFPKMDFKPEDLELPPDEFSGDPDEEGEDGALGEDGRPVRRVRLSAAALAEGEAFIGLEGLISWGRDGTYRGTITRFDPLRTRLMWLMSYEDGDEEWGAVTEDRAGWRVHGGLRPVAWIGHPPPPTDPLNLAAAAADAIQPPAAAQRQPAVQPATGFIVNMMNAEIEVAVGRDGQTRYGSIVDFDPNRPRYKWYVRYVGYAEPAYGGTGEWGCLDDEKATWLTHGYKRPVLSVTGGVGGLLPVAPPKPAVAATSAFTPRKGPFGRTGLGLLYLVAASEPAADGKFRLPVMALGAVRGAYGSAAGFAAAGGKAALGFSLGGKPERVSSQAMAGVPDEYGATLVGAKITITVGRGQGHKRTGTVTEYDANRPKYRWRLTFDAVGEPAHGGAAEWGMLSDDQSLWLAHGYKRNITALAGVPERKPKPAEPPPPPVLAAMTPLGGGGGSQQLALLSQASEPPAAAADGGADAMDLDGGASPDPEDCDRRQRSPTEGAEASPSAGDDGGDAAGMVKREGHEVEGPAAMDEVIDPEMDAALAAVAAAAVAIMYTGNTEVAAGLGIDTTGLTVALEEIEELGTNLVGAKLLVAVGRGGARRSGTITDFEPNRPRYKWRLVYDAEVLPVGVTPAADGAAATEAGAEGAAAAAAPPAGDGAAEGGSGDGAAAATAAPADATGDAAADANGAAAAATPGAASCSPAAPTEDPSADVAAAVVTTATTVVEGEWGTLSDDRTAWLCHGYRRAILASEGVPALPPSYITAAAAAAAVVAAQSPGRKRRPGIIDEQSVASALLTLGKRARREAKAAAAAAREARQAEIAAAGGHVILVQPMAATAAGVDGAVGAGAGGEGSAANGDGADGGPDGQRVKRVKVEPGGGAGEIGVTYVRQPGTALGQQYGTASGGAAGPGEGALGEPMEGAANVGPVSPIANPEGVVGLEIEAERGADGRHRGRVLSYDAKKPRLRWLVRYHDGNQEWGTFADDLTTLRVYGAVRQITWTSRPPAVLPKQSKGGGSRSRSVAARASPAAPGTGGGGGSGGPLAAGSGGARTSAPRRSSENGDSDWIGGTGSGYGSAGTDYRYIFRRNGMCRAQITHQGCAIISPYYDTPEAAAAAADYYNYKLRGTAAHLNLGLTAEQRAVLDQLTLEQLQSYIKGRGDIHDLCKALLQFAGPAGLQLHQQLQQHQQMVQQQLELQKQQELQQQQEQEERRQQPQLEAGGAGDSRAASAEPLDQSPPAGVQAGGVRTQVQDAELLAEDEPPFGDAEMADAADEQEPAAEPQQQEPEGMEA